MPASVHMQLLNDRSISVRNAIHDVNLTLLLNHDKFVIWA
jgi:hydrophobic/amphiphilic exporter-1 (mainly G- bacteria), HAE1 family